VVDTLRRGDPYSRWLLIFDNAANPEGIHIDFPRACSGVIRLTGLKMLPKAGLQRTCPDVHQSWTLECPARHQPRLQANPRVHPIHTE
jgi:hypothetical protein